MTDTHVIPVNDLMPHRETRACWCCPTFQREDDPTWVSVVPPCGVVSFADFIVIHNALDMRGVREKA